MPPFSQIPPELIMKLMEMFGQGPEQPQPRTEDIELPSAEQMESRALALAIADKRNGDAYQKDKNARFQMRTYPTFGNVRPQ